jgi:hypothetical protein
MSGKIGQGRMRNEHAGEGARHGQGDGRGAHTGAERRPISVLRDGEFGC